MQADRPVSRHGNIFMADEIDFDPALVGAWPMGRGASYDGRLEDEVRAVLLETKAGLSPTEELQGLLNDMQGELKAQFDVFKKIRVDAQARLDGTDDAEVKLAKADVKSAIDALSLLVRTIEKVDGLQRTLAEDRMRADEEALDDDTIAALRAAIERRIEERAEELASLRAGRPADETGRGPPGS